jgi:bifunctional UDP-N-acetylglucosamine pyrophosphorylase/glucosamine-1-phosphate N-acetyltransferase
MRPLTAETPKPLVEVAGKPLLWHVARAVPDEVDEFIIVEGYLGEQIKDYCGDEFLGRSVTYVNQPKKRGTADALQRARAEIDDTFLLLYADDLFDERSLAQLLEHENALLVMEHDEPERFGVVDVDGEGQVTDLLEKPADPPTNLVSVGPMVLSEDIFAYEPEVHHSGELMVTSMVQKMAQDQVVHTQEAEFWFPIANPEHVKEAEEILAERQ